MKLHGYGMISEFDTNPGWVTNTFLKSVDKGEFIKVHESSNPLGGNIMNTFCRDSLIAKTYEYEKLNLVLFSDGEYINVAVFQKDINT